MKHLAKSVEEPKLTYFFSRTRRPEDSTATCFAYALLSKISLLGEESLPTPSSASFESEKHTHDLPEADRVWQLIAAYLRSRAKFTLIVDAVDECSDDETRPNSLITKLRFLQRECSIRILFSCRPQQRFLVHSEDDSRIHLSGDSYLRDISTFLSNAVPNSYEPLFRKKILGALTARSVDNFQLAQMLQLALGRAPTKQRALDCVYNFPPDLSKTYQRIVDDFAQQHPRQHRIDRRQVFALLYGAKQTLTAAQISMTFGIDASSTLDIDKIFMDPEKTIRDIGYPFIAINEGTVCFIHSSVKDFFGSHVRDDSAGDERLRLSDEDCDKNLAEKCLRFLLMSSYSSLTRIGGLLHRNFRNQQAPLTAQTMADADVPDVDNFYDYAARNWYKHLVAIANPGDEILDLAADFISSLCFVHCSEYLARGNNELGVILEIEKKLGRWHMDLPDHSKGRLDIRRYFEKPYDILIHRYRAENHDKELQWLAIYRLAVYHSLNAYFDKSRDLLHDVVEGLSDLLGDRNPLTLRAKVDWARLLFTGGMIEPARDTFLGIWEVQREIAPDSADPFVSLQLAALASYYMLDFRQSRAEQEEAHGGLIRVLGEAAYDTLCSKLYLGYMWTALGNDEVAFQHFEEIHKARSDSHGRNDGLGLISLVSQAQSDRILGRLNEACGKLRKAWETQSRFLGPRSPFTIDAAIHLVVAYREARMPVEARKVLDQLEIRHIKEKETLRYCQIVHLQGLMLYDEDDANGAIKTLQEVLLEREEDNRWLLWLRLSLAAILTETGQEEEALILFDKIVREKSEDLDDLLTEPDSPRILRVARHVVNLVRKRQDQEAEDRLVRENCEWVSKKYFWIPMGGPVAETGLMQGPWPD